MGIKLLTSGF